MSKGGMQKNWIMNFANERSFPIYVPKKIVLIVNWIISIEN